MLLSCTFTPLYKVLRRTWDLVTADITRHTGDPSDLPKSLFTHFSSQTERMVVSITTRTP